MTFWVLKKLRELVFGPSCTNLPSGCKSRAVRGKYCLYCWERGLADSVCYKHWVGDVYERSDRT